MIFITGPHGVGKTHIAGVLGTFGFDHIDLGPYLRSIWEAQSPGMSFIDYIRENEKTVGKHFADDLIVNEVQRRLRYVNSNFLLIVGNRSLEGINYIHAHCPTAELRHPIIYIEADEELLFRRYCSKEVNSLSIAGFREILAADLAMGLGTVREGATYIVNNNGNLTDFESTVFGIVLYKLRQERA